MGSIFVFAKFEKYFYEYRTKIFKNNYKDINNSNYDVNQLYCYEILNWKVITKIVYL